AGGVQRAGDHAPEKQEPIGDPQAAIQAEGEGFEPPYRAEPGQRFSRPPHSTTLPPLRSGAAGQGYLPPPRPPRSSESAANHAFVGGQHLRPNEVYGVDLAWTLNSGP